MKNSFFLLLFFLRPLFAEELVYNSQFSADPVSLVRSFVKSMTIIVVMLLIFFYWHKKLLPQNKMLKTAGSNMKIIDKLNLDYTTILYLVEVGNVYQLLTVSNKNVTGLNSFKKSEFKLELKNKTAPQPVFADYLKKLIKPPFQHKLKTSKNKKNVKLGKSK